MKYMSIIAALIMAATSANAETLKEWKDSQEERDSIRLACIANSRQYLGETHTTVTNTVTRPPELVAKELEHVALMAMLGLPPSGSNEQITEALTALKETNFAAAAEISVSLLNVRVYLGDYRQATGMGRESTYTDPHFGQASYDVVTDVVTGQYRQSPAEINGWGVVTVAMIEGAR